MFDCKEKLDASHLLTPMSDQTNTTRTVRETVRRIINEILGVKGLIEERARFVFFEEY